MRSPSAAPVGGVVLLASLLSPLFGACSLRRGAPGAAVTPARDGLHVVPFALGDDYPEESRSLATAREDLRAVRAAGVAVLRVGIGWDDVEPEHGKFEWAFWDGFVELARENGVRLIPYVAYTPRWSSTGGGADYWKSPPRDAATFTDFMSRIAARYRGRVDSWELWNEPDNRDYWLGTAEQYARLLEAGARGVRTGNPEATIVFGGLASRPAFLDEVLDTGAGRFIDAIDVHGYFETWSSTPIEEIPDAVDAFASVIRRHGGRQPIWAGEVGYAGRTPALQAGALVRTLAELLGVPDVALVGWYRLRDPAPGLPMIGDEKNRRLGVMFEDGRPKPAYAALRFISSLFAAGYASLPSEARVLGGAPLASVRAFVLADGRVVAIAWMPSGTTTGRVELEVTIRIETAGEGTRQTSTGEPGPALVVRHLGGETLLAGLALEEGEVAVITLVAPSYSARM